MRIHPNTESDLILTESKWIQSTAREEFEMWNEEWKKGVVMVASVFDCKTAVDVSIYVMRAFVKLREMLGAHKELAQKLSELKRKECEAIRQLMEPPAPRSRRIGFWA